jgi:predicted aminopeptidase
LNINRSLKTLIIIAGLPFLAGCAQIGYYAHCTKGQMELLAGRTPISSLVQDPATPDELRCRLLEIQQIRDFATNSLKLPENGSYRSYADLQRPFATWNVVAVPEFSLEPCQWCFPIAGCVTYRGFFDRQHAEKFATNLRHQGYDVYLYGVAAYSTLGWFDDPVLNTFLDRPIPEVAGLVFHELAHQRLYVPGDTAFSEAFAMTVELLGVERWLATRNCGTKPEEYRLAKRREDDFSQLLEGLRDRLADLYRRPLDKGKMRREKSRLFKDFSKEYAAWKSLWGGYSGYDRWIKEDLNNAKLASVSTYQHLIPAFRALFVGQGSDFAAFYRQAEHMARLSPPDRAQELEKLREIFIAGQTIRPSSGSRTTKSPETL